MTKMLYRSKTYSTDPCNIPRTLAPTCLFMVRESFHKLDFGIFDGMLTRGLLKFSSSWTIQVPRNLRDDEFPIMQPETMISEFLLSLKDDFLSMNFFKGNLEEYSCLVGDSGSMFLALLSSNVASTHMM